jgi:hypothetical protein
MANYVFTTGLGKTAQYVQNVLDGGNDAIVWVPMATSGTAEQGEGLTTLAAVEADANFSEQTGTGWSRVIQDDQQSG